MSRANPYNFEDYPLVDFIRQPMNLNALLELLSRLMKGLPNLRHSLSNLREEGSVVTVTVQISATNSEHIDLRRMGNGVVLRSRRVISFPNSTDEFTVQGGKTSHNGMVHPTQRTGACRECSKPWA